MTKPRFIVFGMLKGGTRKTTSAMFTAFELASRSFNVLLIDADAGTQGVVDWSTRIMQLDPDGGLPFDVAQWTQSYGLLLPFVHQQIKRVTAAGAAPDYVLVDVGGETPEVLDQASRFADAVISPLGADQAELSRLDATRNVVRRAGAGDRHSILLTRVPSPRVGAAKAVREVLEGDTVAPFRVLRTEVPTNRLYVEQYGTVPTQHGAYVDLVQEIVSQDPDAMPEHYR